MENTQSSGDSGFNFKNIQNPFPIDKVIQEQPQQIQRRQERAATCTGFELADWKKAKQQRKAQSNMFYKGKQVSSFVSLPFFKIYGSGIYLFFAFLWEVSVLFIILSLISLAPMIVNYTKGNAYQNTESSLQYIVTKSSIGNYYYTSQTVSESQSLIYKQVNASIDLFCCFLFLVFYFYWEKKSQKIVHEINNQIRLLSASTIEVTQFPSNTKQSDIQQFMEKFGAVSQVAAVKYYSQEIALSKEIYDLQLEIKELEITKQGKYLEQNDKKIQQLKKKAKLIQKQLQSHQISRQQILKFYVQFETIQARQQILQRLRPFQKTLSCCMQAPPQQLLLNSQHKLYVQQCQTQPTGIIWQNVHITWKTRWLRMLMQFIIILAIIVCGFFIISLMNILVPPTRYNVDTSQYTFEMIKKQTNATIISSWCIKNIQFPASPYENICLSHWIPYIKGILITISISIIIVIFKAIVKQIMIRIAKFQRYTGHTEQSVAIMTNLLITYISTTVLITFLMQANVFHISFKSFIKNFITDPTLLQNLGKQQQYYDLTSTWYRDIGYQIWFNVFLLSFIPHIFMPLYFYLVQCISQTMATSQKLHRKMYQKIRPAQFEIEDNYANILMIILIGFVFGGGSPCMIVVSFFGLITRYVYYKYVFIRFSRIPKTYNESLNNRALSILKIILILRCFISIYMYGADNIFAMEKSTFHKWSQSLSVPFFSSVFIIVSRILVTWYYSIFVAIFILALIFKNFILDTLIKLCNKEEKNKLEQSQGSFGVQNNSGLANENDIRKSNNSSDQNKIQLMSQRILTKSYKLQNNPDYIEILAIMKMRYRNSVNLARKKQRQSISPMPLIKPTEQ